MDKVTETWITAPKRPVPAVGGSHQAYLVHIYPTGKDIGTRYALSNSPLIVGRGEDCDIRINDHSVSRRHARIEPGPEGFAVQDLGSTNGTFVNDVQADRTALKDCDYLRIGNCIYRFLAGGNVEAEYHEEIYRLTIIDNLTGIHNKRSMTEFLDRELARSARHARPLALVMIDVDFFRTVNENLGHLGGDYTLREMVACLRGGVRREDLLARYGGEEFSLILVETTREGAIEVAERLRKLVAGHEFVYEGQQFNITISLGIAVTAGDETMTVQELIRQADEKLFQAKHQGRNCVVA